MSLLDIRDMFRGPAASSCDSDARKGSSSAKKRSAHGTRAVSFPWAWRSPSER